MADLFVVTNKDEEVMDLPKAPGHNIVKDEIAVNTAEISTGDSAAPQQEQPQPQPQMTIPAEIASDMLSDFVEKVGHELPAEPQLVEMFSQVILRLRVMSETSEKVKVTPQVAVSTLDNILAGIKDNLTQMKPIVSLVLQGMPKNADETYIQQLCEKHLPPHVLAQVESCHMQHVGKAYVKKNHSKRQGFVNFVTQEAAVVALQHLIWQPLPGGYLNVKPTEAKNTRVAAPAPLMMNYAQSVPTPSAEPAHMAGFEPYSVGQWSDVEPTPSAYDDSEYPTAPQPGEMTRFQPQGDNENGGSGCTGFAAASTTDAFANSMSGAPQRVVVRAKPGAAPRLFTKKAFNSLVEAQKLYAENSPDRARPTGSMGASTNSV